MGKREEHISALSQLRTKSLGYVFTRSLLSLVVVCFQKHNSLALYTNLRVKVEPIPLARRVKIPSGRVTSIHRRQSSACREECGSNTDGAQLTSSVVTVTEEHWETTQFFSCFHQGLYLKTSLRGQAVLISGQVTSYIPDHGLQVVR